MNTILTVIAVLTVIAFYLAWQRANTLGAKHRAETWKLLSYIERLPVVAGLEANKAAKWQG